MMRFISRPRKRSKIHRILRQAEAVICEGYPCMITICGYYLCSWHWRTHLTWDPKMTTCKICKRG